MIRINLLPPSKSHRRLIKIGEALNNILLFLLLFLIVIFVGPVIYLVQLPFVIVDLLLRKGFLKAVYRSMMRRKLQIGKEVKYIGKKAKKHPKAPAEQEPRYYVSDLSRFNDDLVGVKLEGEILGFFMPMMI